MISTIYKSFLSASFFIIGFSAVAQQSDSLYIPDTSIKEKTIRIAAVGDVMLGTNFPDKSYLPPHDGKYLLDSVKTYIEEADLAFCNLEGTYLNTLGPSSKKCKDPKKCYAFRSPEHYLTYVKEAGFDLVSLANNHSGDFGMAGRNRTMELSDSLGLIHAGLENHPYAIHEKDGLKYGFIAFAPNSGCLQLNNLPQAIALVQHLDSLTDIIIVSFHGGAEGSKYQHVPHGTEIFLGENRGDLRLFSHSLIDAGADLILGHGPHVTRGLEIYKERLIAYSLGNFATYSRFNLIGPNGLCPLLLVDLDQEGAFVGGEIIPVQQIGEGIPVIDEDKKVIAIMQQLSRQDFPNSHPVIEDNGIIKVR